MTYQEMARLIRKGQEKDENKKVATQLFVSPYLSIEEIYEILKRADENSENVYINRLGINIYSKNITLDKVYKTITGYTKEKYIKKRKKENEELINWLKLEEKREEEREEERKNNLIEEGFKLIDKEKRKQWKKEVEKSFENYRLRDIYNSLEIMRILENENDLEKAVAAFNSQKNNIVLTRKIKNIMYDFSRDGKEFCKKVY